MIVMSEEEEGSIPLGMLGMYRLKSKTVQTLSRILSLCANAAPPVPLLSVNHNPGCNCSAAERTSKEEAHNETLLPENDVRTCRHTETGIIQVENSDQRQQSGDGLTHVQEIEENEEFRLNPSLLPMDEDSIAVSVSLPADCHADHYGLEKKSDDDSMKSSQEPRGNELLDDKASTFGSTEDATEGLCYSENIVLEAVDSLASLVKDKDTEEGEIPDNVGFTNQLDSFIEDPLEVNKRKTEEVKSHSDISQQAAPSYNFMGQKGTSEMDAIMNSSLVGIVMDNCSQKKWKERSNAVKNKLCILDQSQDQSGTFKFGHDHNLKVETNKREPKEAKGEDKRSLVCYDDLGYPSELNEKVEIKNQGKQSAVKVVDKKRKRTQTEQRKATKKSQKRRKRAEKDRLSGVKRLKLQPILKPKTVIYCDFYLKGRCQQGSSCKFSHDTTPLTKSQPCKFLALQQCLKGDDCPYDHELSKYPCHNYQSNGFCNRGDKCMFSHKMESLSSAATASRTGSDALSLNSVNLVKQPNKGSTSYQTLNMSKLTLKSPSSVGTFNTKHTEQNIAEKRFKSPAQVPKGMSFLSFGKIPSDSCNPLQGSLPVPVRDNSAADLCSLKKHSGTEKLNDSNNMPSRLSATSLPVCSSPKIIPDIKSTGNSNSADKALSSTLAFGAKFEYEMMCHSSSKCPTLSAEPDKGSKSSTSSSIGITTVSDILQEFLFSGGSNSSSE